MSEPVRFIGYQPGFAAFVDDQGVRFVLDRGGCEERLNNLRARGAACEVTERVCAGWPPTNWARIATAPAYPNAFQIAAWRDGSGWIVGEAERDPDEPDLFWWANTRGDYNADDLVASGWTPVFWQPLAEPPAEPHKTGSRV